MEEDLTTDAFLGRRLAIRQPRAGYRAGVDPVILAAAVPARAGETVLELGLGAGLASLCLARRVAGTALTGIELQPDYAALARENAAANGIALEVVEGDLARMPGSLRARSFDHVIANPPYFRREGGTPARDAGRETAFGEATPLVQWIEAGMRRLRPGGRFTLIQRAERVPDLLAAFDGRRAAVTLLPIAPRAGRAATLVILAAIKGGRAPFRLLAPLILHDGPAHVRDGDDYAPAVRGVLRDAAALPDWPH